MKDYLSFLALIGWLLASRETAAQPDFRFDHLSTRQGLSQEAVISLCQDREGFIWFGTMDGLNKYDGYQFTVFKPNPNDPRHSFRHNIISAILEDRKGNLWVATQGGGLHQIDKKTGRVTAYPIHVRNAPNWNTITSICEDANGMIWIGTFLGLAQYNPTTHRYTLYPKTDSFYLRIYNDPLSHIWYFTEGKLHRLDPKTAKVRSFSLPSTNFTTFYIDSHGIFWVGTNKAGLFWADTHQDSLQFKPYMANGKLDNTLTYVQLYQDQKGYLWASTYKELLRINQTTNEVIRIPFTPWQPGGLGDMPIQLMSDQAGNLWLTTFSGIYKLTVQANPFQTHQIVVAPASVELQENRITSLLVEHTGAVWLANTKSFSSGFSQRRDGFYRQDSIHSPVSRVLIDPKQSPSTYSNTVHSVYEDHQHRIWVGTDEGLSLYDQTTYSFSRFATNGSVGGLKEDKQGKLWFSLYSNTKRGIAAFDPTTKQFTRYLYKNYDDTTGLMGFEAVSLLISRQNEIWVALDGGGIARLNQHTNRFTRYTPNASLPQVSLNDTEAQALYEDTVGNIWVGTNQGGLNCLDPKTGQFTHFTTEDGLPSNHILSIVSDQQENLWIGTSGGLSRFTPKTRQFRNFTINDGLPSNAFTLGTAQHHHEKLVFGTFNGYVEFNPNHIQRNQTIPPVYITSLKVLDQSRSILSDHIDLRYSENYLSLEFVALNYDSPEKNQYAYQLEGVDKDWVHSGTRRFVSYTELSPGEYTFRVKASNNDGIWNEKGTALYITIRPPWWRTWWAYSLYVLTFVALLRAYIVYRSRALRRENHVLEEKVALRTNQVQQQKEEIEAQRDYLEETLKELKNTQVQLIQKEKLASLGELTAGIAHEIQNPLNFVNNFSEVSAELVEELKEEEAKTNRDQELIADLFNDLSNNLHKIHHHGGRASSIVKGMLEHSRTESGEKRLTDLNALADEYLKIAYHGLRAKDKNFNCELITQFDPTLEPIEVAPQEIGRVLLNLYNNAFYAILERAKRTTDAHYKPTVEVRTYRQANQVIIQVRDNGTGIPESVKTKIFQPFFTTKPTGEGTGLGLSLSYDIVTKGHGGTLTVESSLDEGSEFIIILPVYS